MRLIICYFSINYNCDIYHIDIYDDSNKKKYFNWILYDSLDDKGLLGYQS